MRHNESVCRAVASILLNHCLIYFILFSYRYDLCIATQHFQGRVIWRGIVKRRDSETVIPSEADEAAKEYAYRLPGVSYQPFPALNLTASDYFDEIHFSKSSVYRKWNAGLRISLEAKVKSPPKEMVFMISGAVRTLNHTQQSILNSWIRPLCSPPFCVAHVVTHFSFSDNRPDVKNDDPKGVRVTIDRGVDNINTIFKGADWPDKSFLHHHSAPTYDIGSEEEFKAMDLVEQEISNQTIRSRLRLLRHGDPRRYSMWFSRAWIWRFVKELERTRSAKFDFYAFSRPDILWFMPSPTHIFFHDFETTAADAWFHDSYYCSLPDTLAFLPTYAVAEAYFSLEKLVEQGVACLGGPNFNTSAVANRLEELKIHTDPDDWCDLSRPNDGWSEQILQRKMTRNVNVRYLPVGIAILRPPNTIDCSSLHPMYTHAWVKHNPSYIAFLSCKVVEFKIKNAFPEPFNGQSLFRLHDQEESNKCLSLTSNGTLTPQSCENGSVLFPWQIFSHVNKNQNVSSSQNSQESNFIGFVNETGAVIELDLKDDRISIERWRREPLHLYSSKTLEQRE